VGLQSHVHVGMRLGGNLLPLGIVGIVTCGMCVVPRGMCLYRGPVSMVR